MTQLTGWFGYSNELDNECAVRLDDVVVWTVIRRDDEPIVIHLTLKTGGRIRIQHPEDVTALAVILERIEFVS